MHLWARFPSRSQPFGSTNALITLKQNKVSSGDQGDGRDPTIDL